MVSGRFGGSPSWGAPAPLPGAASSLRTPASTWGSPSPTRLGTGKGPQGLAPSSRQGCDLGPPGGEVMTGGGPRKSQVGGASTLDPSGLGRVRGKGWEI